MIKIDLISHNYKEIVENHKKYIETYIEKRYSEKEKLLKNDAVFFRFFLGETTSEAVKKLIEICTSSDLEKLTLEFENAYFKNTKKNFKDEIRKSRKSRITKAKRISEHLNYILNYDGFNKGTEDWNRHKYLSTLGVKVCPYCNRNYITTYIEQNSTKSTADADHYYPKSLYPILQMNIYNLIPSCNVCNSKMKGFKDIRHLYPYKDCMSNLKFSTKTDNMETLYNFKEDQASIDIVSPDSNVEAQNSIELFKLDKVYEIHKDVVFDLKRKIYAYEAFQEEYYIKLLGKELGNEIFNGINIGTYWFDFLDKDPLNEPLVKMKQDIYKQLMKN